MRALIYNGPRDVRIGNVPDASIEKETDVLVKITATNICGSDLHMYEGRTSVEKGKVLGHENLGQVVAAGKSVERVKVGDWVCLPFNISCGFCENCERGMTQACLNANPGSTGAAYGYADMGPYNGGQAELLRVPYADFNCLVLPPDAEEKQTDYVMLADIWPTGWHATELAGVRTGESVVIYGSGPVGLFAAYSAVIKGASQVMIVDRHPDRLHLAEEIGAIPIDDTKEDPVEAVMKLTKGRGADKGCECVGWQCHDHGGHEVPNDTMNKLIQSVRATGALGVVGVFPPKDPKPADRLMKHGEVALDFGAFFTKGLRMGSGQTPVKAYNRLLCRLIESGKAKPSFLVSHVLKLDEAPNAYKNFDDRKNGWTKVVLRPAA